MAYNSAHTGPEIYAAVEILGQVQSARDTPAGDRSGDPTLASQVAASANQVASQASTVSTKTAQVLESATAAEQAHAEVFRPPRRQSNQRKPLHSRLAPPKRVRPRPARVSLQRLKASSPPAFLSRLG